MLSQHDLAVDMRVRSYVPYGVKTSHLTRQSALEVYSVSYTLTLAKRANLNMTLLKKLHRSVNLRDKCKIAVFTH